MKTLNRTAYTLLVLAIILGMCSCTYKLEKPFVITDKVDDGWVRGQAFYTYQDANGRNIKFYAPVNKYNIGDTIK